MAQSPTLGTLATTCLVDAAVTEVHAASHDTYGARPVYAELTLGHGIAVGHGCIESLMRAAGVKGLPGIKRARSKQKTSTASDLVDRKFTREEPNELWVTDITEHPSARRKSLSRCLLGYVFEAGRWLVDRQFSDGDVGNERSGNGYFEPGSNARSDHGVQFTSWAFTRRAHDSGLIPSMGSIGDCYDNAVIESFSGRMQPNS
nr:IS3 family transposase [Rhodococcus erythropolis]